MNIEMRELKLNQVPYLRFAEEVTIPEEWIKDTDLLSLSKVDVKGILEKNALEELEINATIDGVMELPCAITLKPVSYPFHIEIVGNVQEMMEETEKNIKKDENSLDLLPIIWENILVEIPMRVISEDAKAMKPLKGDGWRFVTEEKEENPALESLKDLL